MAVLAIDTSWGVAVGVVGPGERAVRLRVAEERKHAELLAPLLTQALAEAEIAPADVELVVVGTGPAPFTGLRAGIVAARTFAFARGVPVLGVPSGDGAAESARVRGLVSPGDELVVLSDARRREVYWSRYRVTPDGVALLVGPEVAAPAQAVADGAWAGAVVVATSEVRALEALAAPDAPGAQPRLTVAASDVVVDPVLLARLALARRDAGLEQPTAPLYLRRPDAVVPGPGKRVTG